MVALFLCLNFFIYEKSQEATEKQILIRYIKMVDIVDYLCDTPFSEKIDIQELFEQKEVFENFFHQENGIKKCCCGKAARHFFDRILKK